MTPILTMISTRPRFKPMMCLKQQISTSQSSPNPPPRARRIKSEDFVASYANFYACNGAVIAAQFGDKEADTIAAKALATHYSGREIITLDVDALGEVGGGIHCAKQKIPV